MPSLVRLHQRQQRRHQQRVLLDRWLATPTGPPRPPDRQHVIDTIELADPSPHRRRAHPRCLGDGSHPTVSQQPRLGGQRQPLLTLVQMRQQHLEPSSELSADLLIDAHTRSSRVDHEIANLFPYASTRSATCWPRCRSQPTRTPRRRSPRSTTGRTRPTPKRRRERSPPSTEPSGPKPPPRSPTTWTCCSRSTTTRPSTGSTCAPRTRSRALSRPSAYVNASPRVPAPEPLASRWRSS